MKKTICNVEMRKRGDKHPDHVIGLTLPMKKAELATWLDHHPDWNLSAYQTKHGPDFRFRRLQKHDQQALEDFNAFLWSWNRLPEVEKLEALLEWEGPCYWADVKSLLID